MDGAGEVPQHDGGSVVIQVGGEDLVFQEAMLEDHTPIGLQISSAAGFGPAQSVYVFQILPGGEHEVIRPTEAVDLSVGRRFVVIAGDHSNRLTIEGQSFDWPRDSISESTLRGIARVPATHDLVLRREHEPDRVLAHGEVVSLRGPGVEEFAGRQRLWKLRVQHATLELTEPTIVVRDAIVRAGENPDRNWQILLSVAGQPRRKVALDDVIDLRTPGIEKLRLRPDDVNNGEVPMPLARDFALLPADEAYLNRLGLRWEAVTESEARWLLIHRYPLPPGYTASETLLALLIPPNYPAAQVYGLYAHPPLALASGQPVQGTILHGAVRGTPLTGWSRCRPTWDPATENVVSHLALVEAALDMEVGG